MCVRVSHSLVCVCVCVCYSGLDSASSKAVVAALQVAATTRYLTTQQSQLTPFPVTFIATVCGQQAGLDRCGSRAPASL